jgi:hypothetical protein
MAEGLGSIGSRTGIASHGMCRTVGINLAAHAGLPWKIRENLGHSSPKVTEVCTIAESRRELAAGARFKRTLSAVKNK